MRGITLALDAATSTASVAVFQDGTLLAEATLDARNRDEERLMPVIAETLARAAAAPGQVTRVVCGSGPGSFTSLRIAAAIAKGLSLSLGAELWVASSLALVVAGSDRTRQPGRYMACLDAMRGEWYVRLFHVDGGGMLRAAEDGYRLPRGLLEQESRRLGAVLVGPGADPGVDLDAAPHARGIARLTTGDLLWVVDRTSWEPDYGRLAEAQVKWEALHGRALESEG
ncbi:MAG: tRNA (adenosine(37)-N6)-threonylcarbamoyltransferase complex dimerization subunit type 1 TsaB [Gemmatimonadaceae bacterium]|nr:tRNA (adenosine(37)-N6)-threonylcarbamoyltransferase complex dimerization subunit type 1 TsaB [Gemmatimonadaceae bacterium]